MTAQIPAAEVAIVGGGLAGLAAANFLAREGLAVTLFEKARAAGGRALTEEQEGAGARFVLPEDFPDLPTGLRRNARPGEHFTS